MSATVREPTRHSIEPDEQVGPKLKLVTSIIRPEKLSLIAEALNQLGLVGSYTVSDARGSVRSATTTQYYRGVSFVVRLAREQKIEVVVREDDVDKVVDAILRHARSGRLGDGTIWVTDVTSAIRIRTGERDLSAL